MDGSAGQYFMSDCAAHRWERSGACARRHAPLVSAMEHFKRAEEVTTILFGAFTADNVDFIVHKHVPERFFDTEYFFIGAG
ncbi:hypothetical protein OJAV_G00073230 [Oryzias javanicus]|uniref:Uncharacterized protein n=1 Tax=Oryzias javanicus TaxID=123683 RepID=A0A437D1R9_ORYJA|nr:hypothetical protein OJAV_G00073230 [Oryzias javanicus]